MPTLMSLPFSILVEMFRYCRLWMIQSSLEDMFSPCCHLEFFMGGDDILLSLKRD